jgi:hypothetical protein
MATTKTLRNNARKKLRSIHEQANGKCHWCNCDTIIARSIPLSDLISHHTHVVIFLRDGVVTVVPKATADHVLEIRNGGTSKKKNLVLACAECNQARDQGHTRESYMNAKKRQWHAEYQERIKKKYASRSPGHHQWPNSAVA